MKRLSKAPKTAAARRREPAAAALRTYAATHPTDHGCDACRVRRTTTRGNS